MILKDNIYNKFVRFFIKEGKKTKARKLLDSAFLRLNLRLNKSYRFIFVNFFRIANIFMEAKKVKIKRNTYLIPFIIYPKRKFFLITKWLRQAINNKRRVSSSQKVSDEIFLVLKKSSESSVLKIRKENVMDALTNRANAHYRW
jgi:ribosomal protein S7